VASRAHLQALVPTLQRACAKADIDLSEVDAIAVTAGPGLMGALVVGLAAAKALAVALDKPLYGVNHLVGHVAVDLLDHGPLPQPCAALLVSGGHTSLLAVNDITGDIAELGSTIDDAAGEAYDKVASILNLGFPGGPIIDRVARSGNPSAHDFPRSMLDREELDFSFSGIKTAVLYRVHGPGRKNGSLDHLSEQDIADLAASFQAAVVDVLVGKTLQAVEQTGVKTVVVGGGVAANKALREGLSAACTERGITLHLTPMRYCGDNGAMIAAMGYYLLKAGHTADLTLEPRATARE